LFQVIQQINGDLKIDDVTEDAPMLKLEFYDSWATNLTDKEKENIFSATLEKINEIFQSKVDRSDAIAEARDSILAEIDVNG